jgi:hypothetical protein
MPVPVIVSVSPDRGVGFHQLFVFHYAVPGGTTVASVQIDIHEETETGARDCNLFLDTESREIGLQFNPLAGPNMRVTGVPGTIGRLENRVCVVDLVGAAIVRRDGDLDVSLPLTFAPEFSGPKQIRSWAVDRAGRTLNAAGAIGNWTVGSPQE